MIYIASDHGGFNMKTELMERLTNKDINYTDLGCYSTESVDYPSIANLLSEKINENDSGIIICGTGIGVSIACNRYSHIRCALCHDNFTARMARQHNNANVVALGGRVLGIEIAWDIVQHFLCTDFEGGRHYARVKMLS